MSLVIRGHVRSLCVQPCPITVLNDPERRHMKNLFRFMLCGACILSPIAQATEIDQLQNLVQSEFKALSQDLVSALSYKSVSPAEPLGITGFDIGVELSLMKMENSGLWQKATGSKVNVLPVPKIALHKGLPFDIDVGLFYTRVPRVDIELYGAELKYAVLAGSALTPAVAIRAAGTCTARN